MGLFLAKEYIRNEKISTEEGIPVHYKDKIHTLKTDERFVCVDDEFLEILYTGDEIKITYGNRDRVTVNNVNGKLTFTIIKTNDSKDKIFLTYPLTMAFSVIHLITYTEKEYDNLGSVIMSRYMEYKD